MTRLTSSNLDGLDNSLKFYDEMLSHQTGSNLWQIACLAAGITEDSFKEAACKTHVSVIPITVGEGLIEGFVQSVQSIIEHLGFKTVITNSTDVAGISEAMLKKANVSFMADDQRFIAINFSKGFFVDNALATAKGYIAALCSMAGGLKAKEVLVIGAGRVGQEVITFLQDLGAKVAVFEIDTDKTINLEKQGLRIEKNISEALPNYKFIVDASPQGEFIEVKDLHPEVLIAAPGIPLGLTCDAFNHVQERLIHDPLQIGVATMVAMAVK